MGTTHMAAGAAGWLAVAVVAHVPPALGAGGAAVAAVAALVPDIDTRGSRISRRLPLVSFVVRHLPGGDHRHLTHSFLGLGIWCLGWSLALLLWLNHVPVPAAWAAHGVAFAPLVFAAELGYLDHIVMDMFTVTGCPLFWPDLKAFWVMPIRECRCHTGLEKKKIRGKAGGRKIHTGEFWFYAPVTWLVAGVLAAAYVAETDHALHFVRGAIGHG